MFLEVILIQSGYIMPGQSRSVTQSIPDLQLTGAVSVLHIEPITQDITDIAVH